MSSNLRRRALALLLACLAPMAATAAPSSAGGGSTATNAARPSTEVERGEADVVHRVVWDSYRRGRAGIHLRSANVDGTEKRRVYDLDRGFTTELTLSRDGRRVAFSTCCRASIPTVVVVPVRGGRALEPLARHPRIDFVGGIGWSPDGRRIAFEGTTGTYPHRRTSLWTVRPNGTGLRRVLTLGPAGEGIINDALAWTPAGILYSDGRHLRAAKAGGSRVVLRRVSSVRISGDGRHIVTTRHRDGLRSVWIGRPDGTDQHRLFVQEEPGRGTWYGDITPSYHGRALLAWRDTPSDDDASDVVMWNTDQGPDSATVVDVVGGSYVVTWN